VSVFNIYLLLLFKYIYTYHSRLISKGVVEASQIFLWERLTFNQNYLAMRNTADLTSGKPIAVWLQSISDGDAVNPLAAFYDIHGRTREVLVFCSVLDTTQDINQNIKFCVLYDTKKYMFYVSQSRPKSDNTYFKFKLLFTFQR
jgi:hypothetical protein